MLNRKGSLAAALYAKWEAVQSGKEKPSKCFVGFDGFTDEIVQAVKKRETGSEFTPFLKIAEFGERIVEAAGKSCNIELVTQNIKLGGNAPIMTNALLSGGHSVVFCGAIGFPGKIEPIFQDMASKCAKAIPIGPSAHSDALEFQDGKIIFGKMDALKTVTYHTILNHIPQEELIRLLDDSELFVCANWTMIPGMNDLWKWFLKDIIPRLQPSRRRLLFVDLADPAKRTDVDLKEAFSLLKMLNDPFNVYVGLNEAEALRVHKVLGGNGDVTKPEALARAICEASGLHRIIIHTTAKAFSASRDDLWSVDGPVTQTPKLTTGGGDNFNAGFCTALLYGLSPEQCLLTGVATSGYYVRTGQSPTVPELAAFLRKWEEVANLD